MQAGAGTLQMESRQNENSESDPSSSQNQQQIQQREQQEQVRLNILTQILSSSARARLSTIAVVKPEKARAIEEQLISMAMSGRLGGRIDEPQLVQMLETLGQAEREQKSKSKISFVRRSFDDDDDEY